MVNASWLAVASGEMAQSWFNRDYWKLVLDQSELCTKYWPIKTNWEVIGVHLWDNRHPIKAHLTPVPSLAPDLLSANQQAYPANMWMEHKGGIITSLSNVCCTGVLYDPYGFDRLVSHNQAISAIRQNKVCQMRRWNELSLITKSRNITW